MRRRLVLAIVPLAFGLLPAGAASATELGDALNTTELTFRSGNDEELIISRLNEDPDNWEYEPVCRTPCAVRVPAGIYEFMAGNHRTFTVVAEGGTQEWVVEDNNMAGIVAGAVLTGLGPGLPAVTIVVRAIVMLFVIWGCGPDPERDPAEYHTPDRCLFFNEDMITSLIVAGSIGGAMLTAGLGTWLSSYGYAERTAASAGTIALGRNVRLLPGLFAYENASGGHDMGLSLALRF
jgi:hypothetical protein